MHYDRNSHNIGVTIPQVNPQNGGVAIGGELSGLKSGGTSKDVSNPTRKGLPELLSIAFYENKPVGTRRKVA